MRILLIVGLLAGAGLAHGGVFRPPPQLKPGDIFVPKKGRPTITKADGRANALMAWEYWWRLNRGPIVRLRARIVERTVVTGTRKKDDILDRAALRGRLVPVFTKALRDKDQAVRTAAAVALGKLQVKEAAPALRALYRNDNLRDVREAALMGLMLMRDPEQRDWLRDIARSEKPPRRIRGLALLGLGFLGDTGFLEPFVNGKQVVRGPKTTVDDLRGCATLALGFCGKQGAVTALLEAARAKEAPESVVGYAGSAIARLRNPIALPDMLELIDDGKAVPEARYGAAIAVGRLVRRVDTAAIDVIGKKAQRDKDRGLRALLILSLGRIGGDRAVTYIVGGMGKAEFELRPFYFLALGMSGHEDAGTFLVDAYKTLKRPQQRAACALGLGIAGHKGAAEMIRKELKEHHPGFVRHGMIALGLLHDKAAAPLVLDAMEEIREPMVRREGAVALALIEQSAAIPELLAMMKKGKSTLSRGAVGAAIGLVGTERCVDPLLAAYKAKHLKDEERALALASLGRICDPLAIPILLQFSEDLNPYVICDAAQELLNIL
ncbi:MAG: HEAT repeat domain-containing protein [Planctomycetota bacterium]